MRISSQMSPDMKFSALCTNICAKLNYPKKWLIFLLPLFLASCGKKENASPDYSDAFKVTFNTVTHYFDLNQPDNGIKYLDYSFAGIHDPTINDRFRFYGFHYNYWHNTKHDDKKALIYADSMLMMANRSVTKEQYAANFAEG